MKHPVNEKKTHSKLRKTIENIAILLLSIALGSGLLSTLYFRLINSSAFSFDTIEVQGNKSISSVDLEKKLQQFKGQPLFALPLNEMRAIIAQNPQIESVVLQRRTPHSLVITLNEHKLIAAVDIKKIYLLNESLQLIESKNALPSLPIIKGLINSSSEYRLKMLKLCVEAIAAYQKNGNPLGRIKEINVHPQLGLISYHEKDEKVTLGFDHFDQKWAHLRKIEKLAQNEGKNIAEVYLASFAVANHVPIRFLPGLLQKGDSNGTTQK